MLRLVIISVKLLFYSILFFSMTTTGENEVCIFGSDVNCFYGCRCQFVECNTRDPNCETCNRLTGLCLRQEKACEYDDFTSSLYEARYWSGEACQKGNIAQGKLYSIEGLFDFPLANGGATDGTFTFMVSAFISPFSHIITVDLEGDHTVEFIDLFMTSELTVIELNNYVAIWLEMKNTTSSSCLLSQPSEQNKLQNSSNLGEKKRMHLLCSPPSIGHQLKVKTLETENINIPVTLYEVVVIGYKHANINLAQCLNTEGDAEINWCTQCNNTQPPECRTQCGEGFTGINCLNETIHDTTTSDTPFIVTSDTPFVVPVAIGVAVSLLVCIAIVTVMCVVCRRYLRKMNHTADESITELEETYDELDDLTMDKPNNTNIQQGISGTVSNEYIYANEVEDTNNTKNIGEDYLTLQSMDNALYHAEAYLAEDEKQLQDEYSSIKANDISKETNAQPIKVMINVNTEEETKQQLQSVSSEYMHTKASANMDSTVKLQDNHTAPQSENDQLGMTEVKCSYIKPTESTYMKTESIPLEVQDIPEEEDDPYMTAGEDTHDLTNGILDFKAEGDPYMMLQNNESCVKDMHDGTQNDGSVEDEPDLMPPQNQLDVKDIHNSIKSDVSDRGNPYVMPPNNQSSVTDTHNDTNSDVSAEDNPNLMPQNNKSFVTDIHDGVKSNACGKAEGNPCVEPTDHQFVKQADDLYFKPEEDRYMKLVNNPDLKQVNHPPDICETLKDDDNFQPNFTACVKSDDNPDAVKEDVYTVKAKDEP